MKRLCAKAALNLVPDHGIIGLGGGETISYLAEDIKEARKGVKVVTPSDHTAQVCKKLGLEIVDTKEVKEIEIKLIFQKISRFTFSCTAHAHQGYYFFHIRYCKVFLLSDRPSMILYEWFIEILHTFYLPECLRYFDIYFYTFWSNLLKSYDKIFDIFRRSDISVPVEYKIFPESNNPKNPHLRNRR